LGSYDLTNEQKVLSNNGLSYEKTFSSTVLVLDENSSVTSSSVAYTTELMPNNWRPQLLNTPFTIEDKNTVEVLINTNK
jgi:hypothetical protein